MATSGVYTFSRNRDQIITDALRRVGAIEAGETPGSQEVTDASAVLNSLIRHWQGTGTHIWRTAEATLFLQADQTTYTLSSTSTDHCTESFVETTILADEANGQTVLSVTSSTGMTAADYVGIQVDDGSFHWTTIVSVDSATQITITAAIDDSAAAGNVVVTYTTKIVRPLKILAARRYSFDSAIDTPIDVEDREEYFDIPNKTDSGTPNLIFYDRRGGANSTGKLYVWQPQSSPTDAIKFTWARPIQDFNAAGDDADLPLEWTRTLVLNLAVELASEYDVPEQKILRLQAQADRALREMVWNETELGFISFRPEFR